MPITKTNGRLSTALGDERSENSERDFNKPNIVAKNINDQASAGELTDVPDKNAILCKAMLKVSEDVALQLCLQPGNRLCEFGDLSDVLKRPEVPD